MLPIDHIIWSTHDLAAACAEFADLTGVTPKFGGKHTDGLTQNALVRIGDRQYLEILSLQDGADLSDPWVKFCAESTKPRLMTYCLTPPTSISALADAAQNRGLAEARVFQGGRTTPEGVELNWALCSPEDPAFGFFMPFFIDWGGEHHPADDAPGDLAIKSFDIAHHDAAGLNEHLKALGLMPVVKPADTASFALTLSTPKGLITLR